MLKLGMESGDQAVLDALNKGIDLQEASAALRSLHKAGIAAYGYFYSAPRRKMKLPRAEHWILCSGIPAASTF